MGLTSLGRPIDTGTSLRALTLSRMQCGGRLPLVVIATGDSRNRYLSLASGVGPSNALS